MMISPVELAALVSMPKVVEGFDGPDGEPLNVVAVAANGEKTSNSAVVVVVAPRPRTIPPASADVGEMLCTALPYP
jgi:hypothetical protein